MEVYRAAAVDDGGRGAACGRIAGDPGRRSAEEAHWLASDAIGLDVWRLVGEGGGGGSVKAMGKVNEEVARGIVNGTGRAEHTLDVDATVIESEKQEARWT